MHLLSYKSSYAHGQHTFELQNSLQHIRWKVLIFPVKYIAEYILETFKNSSQFASL